MSQPLPLPFAPPGAPPETLKAAAGVVELLLATDLNLEQRHYALALARLLTEEVPPQSPLTAPIPETIPDSAPGAPYIDQEVLAELYRYLPASGCAAILEQFRGTAEQLLAEAAEALAAEAPGALARTAHSLIGTVGAVGMARMAQEARAIVVALRQDDWASAASRAATLPALYQTSAAALETVLETLKNDAP